MNRKLLLVVLSLWVLTTLSFAKVYDCFMFFNEYEVLDLRFHELYDHVDHFVIVESCEGFTGKSKEYPKELLSVDEYIDIQNMSNNQLKKQIQSSFHRKVIH